MKKLEPGSWLVAAGRPDAPGEPLNTPLSPASNFLLGDQSRVYSRSGAVAGWEALEEVVGGLEGGKAVAFSSGMAAVAAVFDQLDAGARVALPDDCYHGVSELAMAGVAKGMWAVDRIPVEDTAAWQNALLELMVDPAQGKKLAKQARADVEQYSWEERCRSILTGFTKGLL